MTPVSITTSAGGMTAKAHGGCWKLDNLFVELPRNFPAVVNFTTKIVGA